jgi:hypothetical protein
MVDIGPQLHLALEIKFYLVTKKYSKAAVTIVVAYGLCRVSEVTEFPQLAAANAVTLLVIITIINGPRPSPKKLI